MLLVEPKLLGSRLRQLAIRRARLGRLGEGEGMPCSRSPSDSGMLPVMGIAGVGEEFAVVVPELIVVGTAMASESLSSW